MAENVDLEQLVHLEQTFYDAGYTDGFAHGRIHGLIEGRALGREKGFEIWEEIGFYQGVARTWQALYAQRAHPDQRTAHHIAHLLELVRQFPTTNPSGSPPGSASADDTIDMAKLQSQLRARYRALCASLGVRPTLRAGTVTHGKDDVDPAEGRREGRARGVWTLEGDVTRSTMQGLSF
ncbi:hypothetical protein V8E55_000129 [Tylopilus felleus]|jgi:hypothetical protein